MLKNIFNLFVCFFIVSLTIPNLILAQNTAQLDSIENLILSSKNKNSKLDLLFEATRMADEIDSDKLKYFANEIKKLSNKNKENLTVSYKYLGIYYLKNDNFDTSKMYLDKAFAIAKKLNNDSLIAQIHFGFGKYFAQMKDFDQSINEYTSALTIYKNTRNIKKQANCYNAIGSIYKSQSKYSLSISNFEESLKILEELKDTTGIINECNNIGVCLSAKFDYGEAFNYYLKVISLLDRDKDYIEYSRTLSNIGVLHRYNGEYDIALDYFNRALKISTEKKYEIGIIQAEVYLGFVYIGKKEYIKALYHTQRALDLSKKNTTPTSLALKYRALGDIYSGMNDLNKSLYNYDLSLKNSIKGQNAQYIIYAYLNKADVLFKFKQYSKSNVQIKLGLDLAKENTYNYLLKLCYLSSAKIQYALKNHDQAYNDMYNAYLLQEEVSLQTHKKGLTDAQAMFRTSFLEQENQIKEKELEAKNAKIKETEARSQLKTVIIIVAILLIVVFFAFAHVFRNKNKAINKSNQELGKQNNQIIAQKEVLLNTLDKLKNTQNQLIESEKMASLGSLVAGVAHEMNTPIGISVQASSAIVNRTNAIAEKIKKFNLNKTDFINYIEHTYQSSNLALSNLVRTSELIKSFKLVSVDQSVEEIRFFNVYNYFSDILLTLKPKFKQQNINIQINCDHTIEINSYPGVFAQILTNLVLNSLTHGFKNKEEGEIIITFTKGNEKCKLIYSDNGNGMTENTRKNVFEPFFTTNKQTGTGLGMHIIYNLITQKLNGNIICISKENEGVTFEIEFDNKKIPIY